MEGQSERSFCQRLVFASQLTLQLGDAFFVSTCLFSIGLAGKLTAAVLRPGKPPTGRENAAMVGRVLRLIRQTWAHTNIMLRGDGHFANPGLMALCMQDEQLDFIFGLAGNQVLLPKAERLCSTTRACYVRADSTAPGTLAKRPYRSMLVSTITAQGGGISRLIWLQSRIALTKAHDHAAGLNWW